MNNIIYDVIVIGAGPSGSISSYCLAKNNLNVLIIEKAEFPRDKICAGGITHKCLLEIPFDVSSVLEKTIKEIDLTFNLNNSFNNKYPEPVMYCTDRINFDNFLLEKAKKQGAVLLENTKIIDIKTEKNIVHVYSENGCYKSKFLVGADGTKSIVRKLFFKNLYTEKTIYLEYQINNKEKYKNLSEKVIFQNGTVPFAAGWSFPRNKILSVGVGGKNPKNIFKIYLNLFLNSLGIDKKDIIVKRAAQITHNFKKQKLNTDKILITGDAAGLADYFGGEGIVYAVQSGKIAAEMILNKIKNNDFDISEYSKKINKIIIPELIAAKDFRHIANLRKPKKWYKMLNKKRRDRKVGMTFFRGEKSFVDVKNKTKIRRFICEFIVLISKKIEKRKIRKFDFENLY